MKKRSYKNFDPVKFTVEVGKVSWWELYMCENANDAVETFNHKITDILDGMAPVRTFQMRKNYCPWLSQET